MDEPARVDELASIDTSSDPEPWLRMLRGMWPGDERKQARYRRLFGMLGLRIGSRVLEVGCGAGGALRFLAEEVHCLDLVVGVDPSRLAVAEARRITSRGGRNGSPHPIFLAMDGRCLGFEDEAFDAVFCSRVLVHAYEPESIIREMIRVLRPGGRLLLVEPDRDGTLSSIACDEVNRVFWSHRRSVNPRIGRRLFPMLRDLGLSVEHVEPSFNVSLHPPSDEHVAELERQLAMREGEWWSLVESGRVSVEQFSAFVAGMRRARDTGVFLRSDLEFGYVARKHD